MQVPLENTENVKVISWMIDPDSVLHKSRAPTILIIKKDKNALLFLGIMLIQMLLFSRLIVSDSLRPHGLQHTRLPCPSLSPGVRWNSWPLSWWCYLAISSSAAPFSGKESAYQCRRHGLDPWVGNLPWRREWLPTPVFSPWEFHGHRSLAGYTVHGVTKNGTRLSD